MYTYWSMIDCHKSIMISKHNNLSTLTNMLHVFCAPPYPFECIKNTDLIFSLLFRWNKLNNIKC